MANPLKAAYQNGGAPPAAAKSPVVAPAATAASSAKPAPVQTTQIPPAAGGTRNLSALRAALAAGFVNPPEAGEAVNEDTLAPRTVETEDGGAKAAPGYMEMKGGLVVKAPDTAQPAEAAEAPSTAPQGELSRGQKAAATRAANKAKAAQPSTVAPAAAADPSAAVIADDSSSLARIATALEGIWVELQRRA
jgi:hypothetical protein